jgi:predicted DNA-binding transcriptional regulator AlpA
MGCYCAEIPFVQKSKIMSDSPILPIYKWDKKQLAVYLHRSVKWIDMQLKDTPLPLPGMRLGGRWIFSEEEVAAWMHQKFRVGRSSADHLKKKIPQEKQGLSQG